MNSIVVLSTAEKVAKIICLWNDLKRCYVCRYSTNTIHSTAKKILAEGRYGQWVTGFIQVLR